MFRLYSEDSIDFNMNCVVDGLLAFFMYRNGSDLAGQGRHLNAIMPVLK